MPNNVWRKMIKKKKSYYIMWPNSRLSLRRRQWRWVSKKCPGHSQYSSVALFRLYISLARRLQSVVANLRQTPRRLVFVYRVQIPRRFFSFFSILRSYAKAPLRLVYTDGEGHSNIYYNTFAQYSLVQSAPLPLLYRFRQPSAGIVVDYNIY